MTQETYEETEDISDDNNNLQLAENSEVDQYDQNTENIYIEKRKLLEKTKIVKQTWSILEIYQKIKSEKLLLSPEYQRNSIWKIDKQTAFIESLFMDILVPPIYVVEIPGDDMLEEGKYEVVDGKQRLTAINDFLTNKYGLDAKSLEYFADMFADKKFAEIQGEFSSDTNNLLSSVLDIYVITANSPEFTKYDIFSRLNKGAEKLRVNEIRKAIYRSPTLKLIETFAKRNLTQKGSDGYVKYHTLFSSNDIKRYEDYGRFYRSIAFYKKSKITGESYVEDYNSRPREMINKVLQEIQLKNDHITSDVLDRILNFTLDFGVWLTNNENIDKNRVHYIIDALIPFMDKIEDFSVVNPILEDSDFGKTFDKSMATTTNINSRLKIASLYFDAI